MITKTHGGPFSVSQGGSFFLTVKNIGTGAAAGPIVVNDPLPAGLTLLLASGMGWTCLPSTTTVNCSQPGPVGPNVTLAIITVNVKVDPSATGAFFNTATVTVPPGDLNPNNNTDTDSVVVGKPSAAPLLSPWGMIAEVFLVLSVGYLGLRRRLRVQ